MVWQGRTDSFRFWLVRSYSKFGLIFGAHSRTGITSPLRTGPQTGYGFYLCMELKPRVNCWSGLPRSEPKSDVTLDFFKEPNLEVDFFF